MKTVCFDARMLKCSGVGTYIENLLSILKKGPYRFKALIQKEDLRYFKHHNEIEVIELSSPIYSIQEQFKLPFQVPKCDLFWSPHYNIPFFPVKSSKRLVTIHDVFHLAYSNTLSVSQKIYSKWLLQRATRISNAIITDSEFSRGEIKKYLQVDESKLNVISLGVNRDLYHLSSETSAIGLPKRFILFVGNLKPHKNIPGLLKAFALFKERGNENVDLVIVGKLRGFRTGEEVESLIKGYEALKSHIHFLGSISDTQLANIYRLAEVLVLPSFYEGFGLPPLEAMSSGCAVIVSNQGSLPEICQDAAIYIDPSSPSSIAKALSDFFSNSDLRSDLKEKGLKHSEQFSWQTCADKHLELIDRLLTC